VNVATRIDERRRTGQREVRGAPPALLPCLALAVPLRIEELRAKPPAERVQLGRRAGQLIAEHGDDLLFGGRCAREAWTALVTGLAACAFAPGGVSFAGLYWEAEHVG
jgi:hypothetical protein